MDDNVTLDKPLTQMWSLCGNGSDKTGYMTSVGHSEEQCPRCPSLAPSNPPIRRSEMIAAHLVHPFECKILFETCASTCIQELPGVKLPGPDIPRTFPARCGYSAKQ